MSDRRKIVMTGPTLKFSEALHAEKYRGEGESFREAMNRIAGALTESGDEYHEFRDIIGNMRFLPGGRIQTAIGSTKNVTPYNCFVSGTIEDSFVDGNGSIMQRAVEAATTMRMGGGIGYDFSTLRPRGALIKKLNSSSSGPISFMEIYNAICKCVASSGHRRGAQMGVMRIDHPDIEQFIHAKQNQDTLSGFNMSIAVTDEFMRCLQNDYKFDLRFGNETHKQIDPVALWENVMRNTWDYGEPGVLFVDRINEMNNLNYCEEIAATNPCFTGDTEVWTGDGPKTFKELAESGEDIKVLTQTGDNKLVYRTMSSPRITQRKSKLVEITLDDSSVIRCTHQHRFYLKDGSSRKAGELIKGDRIQSVYRYKANQKNYQRLTNGVHTPLEHHIPFEFDLSGLHVHHRNEIKNDNSISNLKLMSSTEHNSLHMRGDRNPSRRFPESNHFRYRDNSGENNGRYRNDISDEVLNNLRKDGLSYLAISKKVGCSKYMVMKRLGWERPTNHRVISVKELSYREDVYCGVVEETHKFFIHCEKGGVLVSNCAEQPLPPHGACLLGSFNLVKYVNEGRFNFDQFRRDIPRVVRAMDRVVDIAVYPMYEQEKEAKSKRRMGLGVTGLANALEILGMPYGEEQFLQAEREILTMLAKESYRASAMLAKERGVFPMLDRTRYLSSKFINRVLPNDVIELIEKNGIRNSHLTSIAPTGTISIAADNISSGIEPVFSYTVDRVYMGEDGPEQITLEDYGYTHGVHGKQCRDVTVKEHLSVLKVAAALVDSSVSKTLNVPADTPWADFKSIYMDAWESGCKGCTTFQTEGKKKGILKENLASCKIDSESGQKECG